MLKTLRIALGVFLIAHGIAHFVATSLYWKLSESEENPYTTEVLDGRLDLGETGIAIYGALWLLAGIGMAAAGAGVVIKARRAVSWLLAATVFSLVVCVFVADKAIVGIVINLIILGVLFVRPRLPIRAARAAEAR